MGYQACMVPSMYLQCRTATLFGRAQTLFLGGHKLSFWEGTNSLYLVVGVVLLKGGVVFSLDARRNRFRSRLRLPRHEPGDWGMPARH